MQKLEDIPLGSTFTDLRSMLMRLAWLSNTRPDCLLEISQLAQVTEDLFIREGATVLRSLSKATNCAIHNRIEIKIPRLYKDSIRVVGFSDASANNYDLSTHLGRRQI